MKRSTDRIITTHMGSLPRPDVLADLLVAQAEGKQVDAARLPALTDEAIDAEAKAQAELMTKKDFARAYRAFIARERPKFEGD